MLSLSTTAAAFRFFSSSSSKPKFHHQLSRLSSTLSSNFGGQCPRQQLITSSSTCSKKRLPCLGVHLWETTTRTTRLYSSTLPIEASSYNASFFSQEVCDFASLGIQSPILLKRLQRMGLQRPTVVQAKAFADISAGGNNVTVGAETGSGKTLAYLLPLLDDILQRKARQKQLPQGEWKLGYDFGRAIILVPNKELVQQVIRMALPLAGGANALVFGGNALVDPSILTYTITTTDDDDDESTLVKWAIFSGNVENLLDFPPFREMKSTGKATVDVIVATPATLAPLGISPKNVDMFADIATLVIDEADLLLDGGYIKALEQVLTGFRRADRLDKSLGVPKTQHVFVAATLPNYGKKSVDAYLKKRFPTSIQITAPGMHKARHSGLADTTVWLQQETKKERMQYLLQLLEKPATEGGLKDEKVMIFLNSVDDVEGATEALQGAGYKAISYHAKLSLVERSKQLDRFRRYNNSNNKNKNKDDTVPLLVCTDLAARGLDVPNVTAIVQLQFAGNVVAHLHRIGRCGRAGNVEGRGYVFYSQQEAPLIKLVREAEQEQILMSNNKNGGSGDESSQLQLQGPEVMDIELDENDGDDNDDNEKDDKEMSEDTVVTATAEPKPRAAGTVDKAFSRRRGFTRKRKKYIKKGLLQED